MNAPRSILLAITMAITLACGTAQAASYTTVVYTAAQIGKDFDNTCKNVSAASDGTVSGTCNYDNNGTNDTKSASIDLDSHLGCYEGNLDWASTNFSSVATNIDIELDSTGRDYWIVAECPTATGGTHKDGKGLEEGLKNCDGDLKHQNDTTC